MQLQSSPQQAHRGMPRLIVAGALLVPTSATQGLAEAPGLLGPEAFGLEPSRGHPSFLQLGARGLPGKVIKTFASPLEACKACIQFYPAKMDGVKFHAPVFADSWGGGSWTATCRAVPCTTRGDIVTAGSSVESNEEAFCITQVPVAWSAECEEILVDNMQSVYDVTRVCSYQEQIFMPPPPHMLSPFTGVTNAFTRLDGTGEQCLETISKQGRNNLDDMEFCDSDMNLLSRCCESVHDALKCTLETGTAGPHYLMQKDQASADQVQLAVGQATELFDRYCVPLCKLSREEYCAKYPFADICTSRHSCAECTRGGGQWCPVTETCSCPGSSHECAETFKVSPLQCMKKTEAHTYATMRTTTTTTTGTTTTTTTYTEATMSCKYLEMKEVWSQEIVY